MTAVLESPIAPLSSPDPVPDSVSPQDAWAMLSGGRAVLVDIRTPEELKFVGQVPGSLNVTWATGTSLTRNPRLARELEAKVGGKAKRVLLLCRSGTRSALALAVARQAGFTQISKISEGFAGELDDRSQRGRHDGWRSHGLSWTQD